MLAQMTYIHKLKKCEKRLKHHQIMIAHFIPGRIRLKSQLWKQNEGLLEHLLNVMKEQPFVMSVEYVTITGSMVIEFTLKENPQIDQVEKWVDLLLQQQSNVIK